MALALLAGPWAFATEPVAAQGGKLASGRHSDQVAWEQFVAAVAPVAADGVEFETWAADADIYTPTPSWPGKAALEQKHMHLSMLQRAKLAHASRMSLVSDGDCGPVADPNAGNFPTQVIPPAQLPCFAEEVRRNLASFRYIVDNQLNTQAGLAAAFSKAQTGWRVSLPVDAVSIKANWVPVDTIVAWLYRNGVRLTPAQVRSM